MEAEINKLINAINDLSDRRYLLGFLASLSKIELVVEDLNMPKQLFVFPFVTEEGAKYVENTYKVLLDKYLK